jgi:hypothetical protein
VSLVSILEAGRRDFLEATADIVVNVKPDAGWSVLECVEHVVTVEERCLVWLREGKEISPARNADKELRLFSTLRSRLTKVEAPEVYRPRSRFATVDAAMAAFKTVRGHVVQEARARGEALYAVGVQHPRFGDLNGAEVIHLIDGHARRHADQIREIAEAAA